jgi:hygromycin-B 7''-O-kinase
MAPGIYETSKRLGPIDHEQLRRALARFELGDLLKVEPVPFGLFGQNLFVTSSVGEFVFRGAPHGPTQFPTERFFTGILHERTSVPAPWPYQIDDSCDYLPWSYVIMPRMPGLQVTDREVRRDLSAADLRAIARAMAHNLVAMQQVTMPHCSRYDPDRDVVRPVPIADHANWPFNEGYGEVNDPPAHRDLVIARFRRILERARAANDRTTAADQKWAEEIIERARPGLEPPFVPCFTMEDYQEGNAVLSCTSAGWSVSGVFDFMGCYFGDGETDLSRTAAEYFDQDQGLAREFLTTYLKLRPPRAGFLGRFRLYMLLDRLIIWEFFQRHEPDRARKLGTLRDWTERYTRIADTLDLRC